MIRPDEEAGLDLDWYALDAQGHVAHFTTGGCGALPRGAAASRGDLETVREYFRFLPEIGAAILNRDRLTGIRLHPIDKAEPREALRYWADSAARGLYAYDYLEDRRRRPRPYWVVARPEVPLTADELPPQIRDIVARTTIRNVAFAHDDVIGMASLL
jgi:hypothetical protein